MSKKETILPKYTPASDKEEKIGAKEIRQAYFKSWYESCKDIYNKKRRTDRKNKGGKKDA